MKEAETPPGGKEAAERRGPAEGWGLFGPDHAPYHILMLGKMLDRLITQQVRELAGLTLAEWRVLVHLALLGEKSASEVSAAALVDRSEVSRAVATLERRGLLVRVPHPQNRKIRLLRLTAEGRDVHALIYDSRRRFFADVTEGLSAEKCAIFDEALLHITRRTHQLGLTQGWETDDPR